MKIYLASPWFKEQERACYEEMIKKLRGRGYDVYVPIEHTIPNAWEIPNSEWARKVFQADVEAIKQADEVWVLNFGMYSDSGTAWECGYAYGIGKKVRMLLHEVDNFDFSLMMCNGCDEHDWLMNYLFDTDSFTHDLIQK